MVRLIPEADVDPLLHDDEAGEGEHVPLQLAFVRPATPPNVPGGHRVHPPAPARLYCPAGQSTKLLEEVPGGHAYPAGHWLGQEEPTTAPVGEKLPGSQTVDSVMLMPGP